MSAMLSKTVPVLGLLVFSAVSMGQASQQRPAIEASFAHYGSIPLSFERNQGQADPRIQYLARGPGYSVLLAPRQFLLSLATPLREHSAPAHANGGTETIGLNLLGAVGGATPSEEDPRRGTINYFLGNDPAHWHAGVPTFGRIRYSDVYPGVNLVFYGNQHRLEYDFEIAPGSDPSAIRLRVSGTRSLRLDSGGDLILRTGNGDLTLHRPSVYQESPEGRRIVTGRFALLGRKTVGFRVKAYDHRRPLIIDPILDYATYVAVNDTPSGIAVDSTGAAYITGSSPSTMPTTGGAFETQEPQKSGAQNSSAFVLKLNPSGTALEYATYLGGNGGDFASGIAVDAQGNAYITGRTSSSNFPVTSGAFQPVKGPNSSEFGTGFVTKLNPTGTALVYSTYLGGSLDSSPVQFGTEDQPVALALDAQGSVYVTGMTASSNFPVTAGAFQTVNRAAPTAYRTGFVAKLNPAGSALAYATYLGGSVMEQPAAIAVDSSGNAYIGGSTESLDFPTTSGSFQPVNPASGWTGYIAKLNPTGSALVYGTYLGGSKSAFDLLNGICVDAAGEVFATGQAESSNFPTTPGAYKIALNAPNSNAYLTKLNSAGSGLVYSTLIGGSDGFDSGFAVAVEPSGNATVVGMAGSPDFPTTPGALLRKNLQYIYDGNYLSFLARFNANGSDLLYSTMVGGHGDFLDYYDLGPAACMDCISSLALDSAGNVYITGDSDSGDLPTNVGSFQPLPIYYGAAQLVPDFSGFAMKFDAAEMQALPLTTTTLSASVNPLAYPNPVTFTALVAPNAGGSTPTGSAAFSIDFGPWQYAALDGSGTASYTATGLNGGGFHTVIATYTGDANHAPSTSTTLDETVNSIATTVNVTSSAPTALYGTPVTFTIAVRGSSGSGTGITGFVTIIYGNVEYATVSLDGTGNGSWTTSSMPVGSIPLTISFYDYTGDYAKSKGSITETIIPLGVTPAPTFSPVGGTLTYPQQISINDAANGATIYYTTNGSQPTTAPSATNNFYFAPISVTQTETINTIAIASGYSQSAVASATYTINIIPDFSMGFLPATLTLGPGSQNQTTEMEVLPLNGFNQTVSFSCSGAPAGVTCSIQPTTVTFTGSIGAPSMVVVSVSANLASADHRPLRFGSFASLALLLGLFGFRRRPRRLVYLPCVLTLCAVILLNGCGGATSSGGGPTVASLGTYNLTITGTSGSLSHAATLTVNVN